MISTNNQIFLYKLNNSANDELDECCSPSEIYPEYRFNHTTSKKNSVYKAIRDMFLRCEYDISNYNSFKWNPLGCFIQPNQTVLIKPNMVFHYNRCEDENIYSIITHPAILRCVIDYIYIALQGQGKIIIGDAPLQTADFRQLRSLMHLDNICDLYKQRDISLDVLDFRLCTAKKYKGIIQKTYTSSPPEDYLTINLDGESLHNDYKDVVDRFRVTEFDTEQMCEHHNEHRHEYCIHKSVLEADVIISLPKIKTHRKAGYTCALKNLIGINGQKDWLPHHRKGSIEEGGDEYLYKNLRKKLISKCWDIRWGTSNTVIQNMLYKFERLIFATKKLHSFKDNYLEGSWWGNDTISRTINDLNRVIIHADKSGRMQNSPQRKLLYLADGIICGEGEGPMEPTKKVCDLLIWGHNAFAVDMLAVKLMGFDYNKINTLKVCRNIQTYKVFSENPENIEIFSNINENKYNLSNIRNLIGYNFIPTSGWKGHIELEN